MGLEINIKLWGVRGGIPAPLAQAEYKERLDQVLELARSQWQKTPDMEPGALLETLPRSLHSLVGGETGCVEINSGDVRVFLNLGTGARQLAYQVLSSGYKGDLHFLLTSATWEHIQGWPFFVPGFIPQYKVHFYSVLADLKDRFIGQQKDEYFPVTFESMASQKEFHEIKSGNTFPIGPFTVTMAHLTEADELTSVSCRLEVEERAVVFVADRSFFHEGAENAREKQKSFFNGAELMVLDLRPPRESYIRNGAAGELPVLNTALDFAYELGIKKVLCTNHDPNLTDLQISKMQEDGQAYLAEKVAAKGSEGGDTPELLIACEGDGYTL